MKSGMTRWNTVPSYSGVFTFSPLRGSFHSRVPSASSTKLATVLGAFSGMSFTTMSPTDVLKVAKMGSAMGLLSGGSAGRMDRFRTPPRGAADACLGYLLAGGWRARHGHLDEPRLGVPGPRDLADQLAAAHALAEAGVAAHPGGRLARPRLQLAHGRA